MDETTRQCNMAWKRGRDYGMFVGFACAFAGMIIYDVMSGIIHHLIF